MNQNQPYNHFKPVLLAARRINVSFLVLVTQGIKQFETRQGKASRCALARQG